MDRVRAWFRQHHFYDVIFAVVLLFAFINNVRATHDLVWAFSPDFYRDTGAAQSFADGAYPDDPLYVGEKNWYNPLVPALVAGISQFTTDPLHVVYVRAGAYLNILAPIAFYIMVALYFDRRIALASVIGFLFLVGDGTRNTYTATYNPWLFPVNFMMTFFFAMMALYLHVLRNDHWRWYSIIGVLLGLTFLGHTAPALIFGGIFALHTLARLYPYWDDDLTAPEIYRLCVRFAVMVGIALIVSFPLIAIVVGEYGLATVNETPGSYRSLLSLDNLSLFLSQQASLATGIAAIGLISLIKWRDRSHARNLLLLWFGVALGMLFYDYVVQIFARIQVDLPTIIPSWHFLVYLEALKSVLFGYGLLMIARFVMGMVAYLFSLSIQAEQRTQSITAVFAALLVIIFIVRYPTYHNRDYFNFAREEAQFIENVMVDRAAAYEWVLTNTDPDDVFLASDDHLKMFVVAQAGRKLTVAPASFSNPYIQWEPRDAETNAMIDRLINGDQAGFEELAAQYGVDYVIVSGEVRPALLEADPSFLEVMFDFNEVMIYRWNNSSA